jgi:putative membrane protein
MAFLSEPEQARVRDAVRRAEEATSGEFVTVIASASDGYRYVPTLWAALIALSIPGVGLLIGVPFESLYALQIAAFLVLAPILRWTPVKMRLIPRDAARRRAARLAQEQFITLGLHRTTNRAGILLFVSVAEQYVDILVDEGIGELVDKDVWKQIVDESLAAVREGRVGEGMVIAIDRCTDLMARYFPPVEGKENLLPDHLIQIAPG